jgi:predicted DsbA family dithiol-disulfide isomerase
VTVELEASLGIADLERRLGDPELVLHWYDFICPFCYVAQARTEILLRAGFHVVELPFQIHPETPKEGLFIGPRKGEMYERLEREARDARLALNWPPRLANSGLALSAAEWIRLHAPGTFAAFANDLFAAHFVRGEDLGDPATIDRYAVAHGIDLASLHAALADGSAASAVVASETLGRKAGVQGTPAWLVAGRLISGLQAEAEFERLAL